MYRNNANYGLVVSGLNVSFSYFMEEKEMGIIHVLYNSVSNNEKYSLILLVLKYIILLKNITVL